MTTIHRGCIGGAYGGTAHGHILISHIVYKTTVKAAGFVIIIICIEDGIAGYAVCTAVNDRCICSLRDIDGRNQ